MDHTLAQALALAAGSGAVELCASPDFSAPDWAAYPLPPGVATSAQGDGDAALYPALDGGYTLLGLRAGHPSLFTAIPWSTARVAAVTRARMQALGWRVWVGAALADIDTPPDLLQLPEWLRQTLDQTSNGSTSVASAAIPNTAVSH